MKFDTLIEGYQKQKSFVDILEYSVLTSNSVL